MLIYALPKHILKYIKLRCYIAMSCAWFFVGSKHTKLVPFLWVPCTLDYLKTCESLVWCWRWLNLARISNNRVKGRWLNLARISRDRVKASEPTMATNLNRTPMFGAWLGCNLWTNTKNDTCFREIRLHAIIVQIIVGSIVNITTQIVWDDQQSSSQMIISYYLCD